MVHSLRLQTHPRTWKVARGVPISKPNRTRYDEAKSYRTISLLNCLAKVVERVVTELLCRHCEGDDTLHERRFGARRKRSAVEPVGTLVSWVEESWRKKEITGTICMDVAAAFSSVVRGCLARWLREMNVDEDIVGWTGSFMQERKVRMVIDGREEEELEATTGLPQGSLVSSILFIIYVSGVHRAG